MLTVTPMIWIQNQLVGAQEGQQMTLECHSEAFPKSINYWTRENVIIANGMLCLYEVTYLDKNALFIKFARIKFLPQFFKFLLQFFKNQHITNKK